MRHLFLLLLFPVVSLAYLHSAQEPLDSASYVAYLRSDSEEGDAVAQWWLGLLYHNGTHGLAQDYVEAQKWWLKAAEQGHAPAQFSLGAFYHRGDGVTQDYTMAYVWYNVAAAQGHAGAKKIREVLAEELDAASLAEAQKLSTEHFKRYVEPFQ